MANHSERDRLRMKWVRRLRWIVPLCVLISIIPIAAQMIPAAETTTDIFPPDVMAQLDLIYGAGQARGNRPDVFSKVGDSITVSQAFFAPIGEGDYSLAEYSYLQPVVDYYVVNVARTGNSFLQPSLAAGVGWAASAVFDTRLTNTTLCAPGESPLVCEYRLTKPSAAVIMFGTNDVGYVDPQIYRQNMQKIIVTSMDMGVIPVVSTIPNRAGLEGKVALYNAILIELTAQYHLPLWDYAAAMQTLPGYGLGRDGIHPSAPDWDYRDTADFSTFMLQYGYTQRNLTGLQMLYRLWQYFQTKV